MSREDTEIDQKESYEQIEEDRRQTSFFAATTAANTPAQIIPR